MAGKQATILTNDQVASLLDFATFQTRWPVRNRLMVLLSVKAGLRGGEISNLTWNMILDGSGAIGPTIDLPDRSAKKGSGRRIPMRSDLSAALIVWRDLAGSAGPVIKSERGAAMTPVSVVNWFALAYRAVGLTGCSSHSGRRRLKALRLERGLTLTRLAELSGVPVSTISKIENRQLRPSLVNAINLAIALKENLGFLVDRYRSRPEPITVVRAGSRDTIEYDEMGLTLQDLSGNFVPGVLEARIGMLAKGAHSGVDPMTHKGEELCVVLAGAIRYRLGEEIVDLSSGEFVHFKSEIKHSWENVHPRATRVLWVFSDGLSF